MPAVPRSTAPSAEDGVSLTDGLALEDGALLIDGEVVGYWRVVSKNGLLLVDNVKSEDRMRYYIFTLI